MAFELPISQTKIQEGLGDIVIEENGLGTKQKRKQDNTGTTMIGNEKLLRLKRRKKA